jgi:hypothetical protein
MFASDRVLDSATAPLHVGWVRRPAPPPARETRAGQRAAASRYTGPAIDTT